MHTYERNDIMGKWPTNEEIVRADAEELARSKAVSQDREELKLTESERLIAGVLAGSIVTTAMTIAHTIAGLGIRKAEAGYPPSLAAGNCDPPSDDYRDRFCVASSNAILVAGKCCANGELLGAFRNAADRIIEDLDRRTA
jgi:hypothetical protein